MNNIFVGINYLDNLKSLRQGKTQAISDLILLRNEIVFELRSRGCQGFVIPEDLSLDCAIQWVNDRADFTDVALAIAIDYYHDSHRRGTYITHIANNLERKKHAEIILLLLLQRLPNLISRGSQADTITPSGQSPFCRQVIIPSLQITLGCLSNPEDKDIIINEHPKLVGGLADGLIAWSREITGIEPNQQIYEFAVTPNYSLIEIRWNNKVYAEKGILVNGNPCIPIDLVELLGINLTCLSEVKLIEYQGKVYLKIVDLQTDNISFEWEHLSQTLSIRSILSFNYYQIDKIMGLGKTSEVQMMMFLKVNNEQALREFPQIAKLYREEAAIEGVNPDIAFSQMCLETDFLRFGKDEAAKSYNFAKLATVDGQKLAIFADPRLGVRSHIQHLKAYASLEPLILEIVDPRFHLVARGVASTVFQLSRRWSADLAYGDKIMAIIKRLYEFANLL